MRRTLVLALLVLAAARGALADGPAAEPAASDTAAPAAAPATAQADAGQQRPKKPAAGAKTGDGKGDPQAAASQATQPGGDVKMSGMSILGNEDAPKSLVLVPWKSSQLADMPSVSRLLDSATQPVDKDVFMRELAYYEFKSGSK